MMMNWWWWCWGWGKDKATLMTVLMSIHNDFCSGRFSAQSTWNQRAQVSKLTIVIWQKSIRRPDNGLKAKKATTGKGYGLELAMRLRIMQFQAHMRICSCSCGYMRIYFQYAHDPHIDICNLCGYMRIMRMFFPQPHMYAHTQTNPSICISKG